MTSITQEIVPVLLAGGAGTRLWPLSRKSFPKQFSNVVGAQTLFQQSALRLCSSDSLSFARPMTLTNADFRFIVGEQLQAVGIDPGPILIEPSGRNTAPAILAASLHAAEDNPDAILLVAPSDHVVPDITAFHQAVLRGLEAVNSGKIVTFGISPDRPETGYGYLELEEIAGTDAKSVRRFVEKPDKDVAQNMLNAGNYLWNAGIFMFKASDMIAAFSEHASALMRPVKNALEQGKPDLGFFRLDPDSWSACKDVSIDYAIMEKASNLVAIPFSAGWSDLGGWDAVWAEQRPDQDGVVCSENAIAIDCKDTLLRSESDGQQLVGLGLENIIAVAMPDAVLVADMGRTQDVKKVVSVLKEKAISQAEIFPKDHRPWGWFETLVIKGRFQVKRIFVNPGAALSLQSHHHRSEHWVVVEGTAKVSIDEKVLLVTEGESVHIPVGAVHRMENPGKLPMVLIEVQTGSYLGEDDIIRYEDIYSRN